MTTAHYRHLLAALLAATALALGIWMGLQALQGRSAARLPPELAATVLPSPKPLAPFALIDQERRPFRRERLEGRWSFLFFGYTHCPDVCPTTMTTLHQARERLTASQARDTQFVLVSVDPERDTPEQLKGYVSYFNKDFLGITGDDGQLQRLTAQLGILYMRAPGQTEGEYLVDHTSAILLIDPQARLVAVFSAPHNAENIASAFLKIRDLHS